MTNDHDILIKVQTILEGMVSDFRAYRAESHKAISTLEAKCNEIEKMKVSVVDFAKHTETDNLRLARLEKWQWMMMGAIVILQFIAPFIVNKLLTRVTFL